MGLPLPSSPAAPWLASAVWLVARGTLLLLAAALAARALRRGSAAARHLAWGLALAAMLALPAASLLLPRWEVAFVQVVAVHAPAEGASSAGGAGGVAWSTVALAVWAAGALAALARYLLAILGVRVLARGARPVVAGEWMERMRAAAREVGLREPVRLLRARGAAMPMTWGILRPVVLVPADADGWTPERRRVVLLHELAHVARRDCLWQTLASLCCAAYWFHPGVWWAARQMRIEREQACDDRVLRAGTRASEYAGHLLEVARASRPSALTAAAAPAMARRSQLENRVRAVLDAARDRGAVPGRAALVAGGVAAVALFPLAAASPRAVHPAPRPVLSAARATPPVRTADALPAAGEPLAQKPGAAAGPPRTRLRDAPAAVPPRVAAAPAAPDAVSGFGGADEQALTALVRATHDADPEVRRSAVWALGQMNGGREVLAPLVESMGDSDARVRSAAALALGEYAERQTASRASAARPAPCEGAACPQAPRAPAGSAPAATRPRNARTDMNGASDDPVNRLLGPSMESDTLSRPDLAPVVPSMM